MLSARPNAAEFAGDDDPLPVTFDFDRAPADALESLDARKTGERISWNWRDTWEEQHREAFVVAKMAKADMLKEVHDSLREAMENGTPYEEWRKRMEASLQDRWIGKTLGELWDELPEEEKQKRPRPEGAEAEKRIEASRLRTIYYTNSIVSSQAGQYKQLMKQAEDYPYWRYKTAGDSRVRESHRALHNKVFRYNDPFWETHYPPNGWFCRCSVEALDDYDLKHLEDKEIKVEDGGSHVSWKTRPNGDKVAVWQDGDQRVECAPGWSYNVGRPGYRQQVAEEKAKEYPVQLRKQIEAESAKEDREQSERTKKLEEIAKRLEEQRKRQERPRVEVVRKAQPSETPLELQRKFREEEKALIAQHRGKERFEAIASGDRKLMREMRRAEEDALAELRTQQRQRLEAAQRQAQTVKPLEKLAGLDGAKGRPKAQTKPEDQNQVERPRQAEKPEADGQKAGQQASTKQALERRYKYFGHLSEGKLPAEQSSQSDSYVRSAKEDFIKQIQHLKENGNFPQVPLGSPQIIYKGKNVSNVSFLSPGYNSINDAQVAIHNKTLEHAIIFDKNKKCLVESIGCKGNVDLSINYEGEPYIVIHNHPEGSIFSADDIGWAMQAGVHELRVLCKGDGIYSFSPKKYMEKQPSGNAEFRFWDALTIAMNNFNDMNPRKLYTTPESRQRRDEDCRQYVKEYIVKNFPGITRIA